MELNKNYKNFPSNFFTPYTIECNRSNYLYYPVRFGSLYEIYHYLKSKPEINKEIFYSLSSREGSINFAGVPYNEAVENLIKTDDTMYFQFLDLIKDVSVAKSGNTNKFRKVYKAYGSHLSNPRFVAGAPLCYEGNERIKKPKFINVYATFSYSNTTSRYQVFNRAIILISFINALEKHGYKVNLNAFELSRYDNEMVNIMVELKNYTGKIDIEALYKSSCKIEFLRRILFAVLETIPVKNTWNDGYGRVCPDQVVRDALNIGEKDIYFGTPQDLSIGGGDIVEDFHDCLKILGLEQFLDFKEINEEFNEKVKQLLKTR